MELNFTAVHIVLIIGEYVSVKFRLGMLLGRKSFVQRECETYRLSKTGQDVIRYGGQHQLDKSLRITIQKIGCQVQSGMVASSEDKNRLKSSVQWLQAFQGRLTIGPQGDVHVVNQIRDGNPEMVTSKGYIMLENLLFTMI